MLRRKFDLLVERRNGITQNRGTCQAFGEKNSPRGVFRLIVPLRRNEKWFVFRMEGRSGAFSGKGALLRISFCEYGIVRPSQETSFGPVTTVPESIVSQSRLQNLRTTIISDLGRYQFQWETGLSRTVDAIPGVSNLSHPTCEHHHQVSYALNTAIQVLQPASEDNPFSPATLCLWLWSHPILIPCSQHNSCQCWTHETTLVTVGFSKDLNLRREPLDRVRFWLDGRNLPTFVSSLQAPIMLSNSYRVCGVS